MRALRSLAVAAVLAGVAGCASQPAETAQNKAEAQKNCLRDTGSRIKPKAGQERCVNAPGKVYTAEDLEQTGAATVSEALQQLGN